MEDFDTLNQFATNLRWLASHREPDPSKWAKAIEALTRRSISYNRVIGLLWGANPSAEEVDIISTQSGIEEDELQSVPLYGGSDQVRKHNVTYLLDALPQGEAQAAAKKVGITASQLSRWRGGVDRPRSGNLRKLLRFHGIDPDTDLEKVPLFLSMEPVSGYHQKKWVADRLMEMPAHQMAAIYPALKKMLRSDEDH